MNAEELQKLGFKENEAKIYLILLEHGPMQAGEISKKVQLNRRTVYDVLERLLEQGYASYQLATNKRLFKAADPKTILSKIKEMEISAKELIPNLEELYQKAVSAPQVEVYVGKKGIRTILFDLLTVKEYEGFGSNEKFPEIMQHDFFQFQKRKKELGVKSRTLMSESMRKNSSLKDAKNISYRFLSEEFSLPTSTFMYGNKTAIIIWSSIPTGIVIKSEETYRSFKGYFESLWKIAKK